MWFCQHQNAGTYPWISRQNTYFHQGELHISWFEHFSRDPCLLGLQNGVKLARPTRRSLVHASPRFLASSRLLSDTYRGHRERRRIDWVNLTIGFETMACRSAQAEAEAEMEAETERCTIPSPYRSAPPSCIVCRVNVRRLYHVLYRVR